ncbi:hypothetical protein, partial [Gemmiger sp.]|uniref:hypothetical protein n=1 Tax=Gemmiger sp. TaxID=2049027 RepID=UPI003AB77257
KAAVFYGSLTISVQRDFPKKIPWIVSLLLRGWRNEIRKTQQATEIALGAYLVKRFPPVYIELSNLL